MKAFFIALFILSFSQADEMQRIESIVKDITKLRSEHEECLKSLKTKETLKVDVLKPNNNPQLIQYQKQLKAENEHLNNLSQNNEKIIKKYQKLLKAKENEILALKKSLNNQPKESLKRINDNPFPKLMPKESTGIKEIAQITKANTFRLKSDSKIYDSPNANEIDVWTQDTSFTSNMKTANWVKITGFFIDKKWRKAKKNMWIKKSQVSKR